MRLLPLALTVLAISGCDRVKVITVQDAGPVCPDDERLVNGDCRFVCTRDGDCATGKRCDLLLGACVALPPPVDAGPQRVPCTEGAVRCAADNGSVERCSAEGFFAVTEQCTQPEGYCQNERCLRCRPGAGRCANNGVAEVCLDDGSGYRQITCAPTASCASGACVSCTLGERRCSADGRSLEECRKQPREELSTAFVPAGDNFDGTCISQACQQGAQGPECRPAACIPQAQRCANSTTQQVCSATGAWVDSACSTLPNMGPGAECINGTCIDECSDAVRARSYFGCEYWTTVLDNGLPPSVFKGNFSAAGQGTADSEFAFVVANRSALPAVVTIRRWANNAEQVVKTVTVPGRNDPATKGVAQIRVPWHHVATPGAELSVTGKARTGYRITSSRPVTMYQFNPLSAVGRTGACTTVSQCTQVPSGQGQQCVQGVCNYFSFSNDASLLLPVHILGTSYVGLTMEHTIARPSNTGAPTTFLNGSLTVVASQNNTSVTIRSAAKTLAAADNSVQALAMGESRTITLAAYEVLQLASDMPAGIANGSSSGNLECGDNPFADPLTCSFLGGDCKVCRTSNGDLTGTIITSDKPIAVFGGAACATRGYVDSACDHVEEQLFPFVTWGKSFVASRTAPLRLTNDQFASGAAAGPDYYKIVAGCPSTSCPNGTLLTLSSPPSAGDVLSNAGGCSAGTSLSANNCRLTGGKFIEFRSKTSFTITADQPIQVAQIFASQNATTGNTRPAQGDPSLVLLPPVEQWRANYTVLTAPGTRDNYLGLVVDSTRVAQVKVDGTVITTGWTTVASTAFKVVNVPVLVGSHTIEVQPVPNQTQLPGAGVTVYGFDEYVSYGYTGGLDLTTIVTGVNPGG